MRVSAILAVATTLSACVEPVETPFPGYGSVQAGRDCGPAGGGTIAVVLRPGPAPFDTAGPQLKIAIRRDLGELAGKTFASTDQPETGSGFECGSSGTCEPLAVWRIRVTEVAADSSLAGVLETGVPGGTTRRGSFHAAWHARRVYCM